MKPSAEQRGATRYRLRTPAIFNWQESGAAREHAGITRDVSAKGVFVYCPSGCPNVGTVIQLKVMLPPLEPDGRALQLDAMGVIVRIEKHNDEIGFGATMNFQLEEESWSRATDLQRVAEGTEQINAPSGRNVKSAPSGGFWSRVAARFRTPDEN